MSMRRALMAAFFCLVGSMGTIHAADATKNEFLLYCGITMVRPMTEIAQAFEKREGIKIVITQGGSEDLYQSAKKSGMGDWYLPGEPTYRDKHQAEGLFGDYAKVGYNQLAMVVQKGNPKQVKNHPKELLRKDLVAIVGNADSGSVGKETKDVLDQVGIDAQVMKAAGFLSPDSRSLMNSMKKKEADVAMNWRAVGFFPDNAPFVDVIDLDPKLARPQALLLIQLKSTRNPALARKFVDFTASEEGQAIFRRHGFLDNKAL